MSIPPHRGYTWRRVRPAAEAGGPGGVDAAPCTVDRLFTPRVEKTTGISPAHCARRQGDRG